MMNVCALEEEVKIRDGLRHNEEYEDARQRECQNEAKQCPARQPVRSLRREGWMVHAKSITSRNF